MAESSQQLQDVRGEPAVEAAGVVDLRYVARAGLLPELSAQTYDSFYKALREAVLNSADAGATLAEVDLSSVESERRLVVRDDGAGMSLANVCEHFMSLGGSGRFGDTGRFGRIGIGSLALLQYGESAVIETKTEGSPVETVAALEHPWRLGQRQRRKDLSQIQAGTAREISYTGPASDHFTSLTLNGVSSEVFEATSDPVALYQLVDILQRVLPLPWSTAGVWREVEKENAEVIEYLESHAAEWSLPVEVITAWGERLSLKRRSFGDGGSSAEIANGKPRALFKRVGVADPTGRREITVAGYLASQRHPSALWSGLTARVQSVAVELNTFFGVTSDPGFRKYITGEVWIAGEVDADRLINIDRGSFNQESADYREVQRYMSAAIKAFKSEHVQRPQQAKVAVRRVLEDQAASLRSIQSVLDAAFELFGPARHGGLPSSGRPDLRGPAIHYLRRRLHAANARVRRKTFPIQAQRQYAIESESSGVVAYVDPSLLSPVVAFGDVQYRLRYLAGLAEGPSVVIRNRPREILLNTAHPALGGAEGSGFAMALGLEIAFVVSRKGGDVALYEAMLSLVGQT